MRAKYKKVNAVECPECLQLLISWHRHDYVVCECPNGTMVDGGFDYERSGGVKKPRRMANLYVKVTPCD